MNVTININGDIFFKGINPFDKGPPPIAEDFFDFDDLDGVPEFLALKEAPIEPPADEDPVGTGVGNTVWVFH